MLVSPPERCLATTESLARLCNVDRGERSSVVLVPWTIPQEAEKNSILAARVSGDEHIFDELAPVGHDDSKRRCCRFSFFTLGLPVIAHATLFLGAMGTGIPAEKRLQPMFATGSCRQSPAQRPTALPNYPARYPYVPAPTRCQPRRKRGDRRRRSRGRQSLPSADRAGGAAWRRRRSGSSLCR